MSVSPEMKIHLAQNTFLGVFLKITAIDGTIIRVWSGTRNKIISGDGTYIAYPISPSRLQQSAGLKADNLEIAATYAGAFTAATLRARKWQGARCEYAVYNYKDFTMGYAERRVGFIGKTEIGKFAAKPELVSLSSKLNQAIGRTFNTDCDVVELSDVRCGVDLTGFTADGYRIKTTVAVASVSNRQQFTVNFTDPMVRGLRARYYSDNAFATLVSERLDPTIDFDYGQNAPFAGMPTDGFSIRWEGFVTPRYSQTYTFSVEHDDGTRLYVNNLTTPLINQWVDGPATHSATIALTAGVAYNFKLDFYDLVSVSKIKLKWSSTSETGGVLQTIPAARFTPTAGYSVPNNLYHRGKARFLSGANTGFEMQILANTGNAMTLYLPMFYDLATGDSVELIAGCNRTIAQCRDRFANGINHQGFPYIPGTTKLFHIPSD